MIEPHNGFEQAADAAQAPAAARGSSPASDEPAAEPRVSAKAPAEAEAYIPAYARSAVAAKAAAKTQADSQEPSAEAKAPAKKTRTRKKPAEGATLTAEPSSDQAVSASDQPEPPKRKRGRPRKVKAEDPVADPSQAPAADGQSESPKPRRTRTKKASSEEKANEGEAKPAEESGEDSVAPKTRRKAVSSKGKTQADKPEKADKPGKEEKREKPSDGEKNEAAKAREAVSVEQGSVKSESASAAAEHAEPPRSNTGAFSFAAAVDGYIPAYARSTVAAQAAARAQAELQASAQSEASASNADEARGDDDRNDEGRRRNQHDGGKKRNKNQRQKRERDRDRDRDRDRRDNDRDRDRERDRRDNDRDRRRQRRQHQSSAQNREPVVPKTTAEDLAKLKVIELRQKAEELGVSHKGLLKADLVKVVLEASIRKEGFIEVEGVLDLHTDGYGFLRTEGYLPSEHDVYVGASAIRRNGLRKGDYLKGQIRPARENDKFAALQRIDTVNGIALEDLGKRPRFADLTPVYPDERLLMEHGKSAITARVIDLAAPIGKGQRGLIVSPPKAGKTTVLKDIAASITANNPEVHLICLLVDERPEEVTDMQRSIKGEVVSSTFDMPSENHIAVAEMVIERAKRLVENGKDVVILLDSITRLARAYNLAQPASGRILSGGVDSTALYPPKRFLGAARNIEGGGSLTILASALIETGSKMDEVIFEEFKGTGNMELKLDRYLADRRIFPAIDPISSGTRKEELLLDPQEAPLIWAVRRILSNMNNTERAMDMLIKSLKQTDNNQAFLLRTAKKAQMSGAVDGRVDL